MMFISTTSSPEVTGPEVTSHVEVSVQTYGRTDRTHQAGTVRWVALSIH